MRVTKFNINAELRKTLAGKPSKVCPLTLLHVIGPEYLKAISGEKEKDE